MTTQEQNLYDAMKDRLLKEYQATHQQITQGKTYLMGGVYGEAVTGAIKLTVGNGQNPITITPETFKALNDFAVRIGWQCD